MANSTDASIISSGTIFDHTSASSRGRDQSSDTELTAEVIATSGMSPDTKLDAYLAHNEATQRARTGSLPVTPRSAAGPPKPISNRNPGTPTVYGPSVGNRGRASRASTPTANDRNRTASAGSGSQTKRKESLTEPKLQL